MKVITSIKICNFMICIDLTQNLVIITLFNYEVLRIII